MFCLLLSHILYIFLSGFNGFCVSRKKKLNTLEEKHCVKLGIKKSVLTDNLNDDYPYIFSYNIITQISSLMACFVLHNGYENSHAFFSTHTSLSHKLLCDIENVIFFVLYVYYVYIKLNCHSIFHLLLSLLRDDWCQLSTYH